MISERDDRVCATACAACHSHGLLVFYSQEDVLLGSDRDDQDPERFSVADYKTSRLKYRAFVLNANDAIRSQRANSLRPYAKTVAKNAVRWRAFTELAAR